MSEVATPQNLAGGEAQPASLAALNSAVGSALIAATALPSLVGFFAASVVNVARLRLVCLGPGTRNVTRRSQRSEEP